MFCRLYVSLCLYKQKCTILQTPQTKHEHEDAKNHNEYVRQNPS